MWSATHLPLCFHLQPDMNACICQSTCAGCHVEKGNAVSLAGSSLVYLEICVWCPASLPGMQISLPRLLLLPSSDVSRAALKESSTIIILVCVSRRYEYHWADGTNIKKPIKCSAPKYIDYLMTWVQDQLDDETLFPSKIGRSQSLVCFHLKKRRMHSPQWDYTIGIIAAFSCYTGWARGV